MAVEVALVLYGSWKTKGLRLEGRGVRAAFVESQTQKWRNLAAAGEISPRALPAAFYEGRLMPSLIILERRVERLRPSFDAAPRGPPMIQFVSRRARRMCARSASSRRMVSA